MGGLSRSDEQSVRHSSEGRAAVVAARNCIFCISLSRTLSSSLRTTPVVRDTRPAGLTLGLAMTCAAMCSISDVFSPGLHLGG
jgi:hypothetical protein